MIMNFEEYKRNLKDSNLFAPGIDAIHTHLESIYKTQEPTSYALCEFPKALFSNANSPLNFELYNSTSCFEHSHLVSFGFSELYGNEHNYMREKSKFGYEITLRTSKKTEDLEDLINAINNIFKYNKKTSIYLEENTFFDYRTNIDENSSHAGFIIIKDTELNSIDTVHGQVDFLQLYPIDSCTLDTLKSGKFKFEDILNILKETNELLIIK